MSCNFRVGQRVVCVDARWYAGASPLRQGAVYTIAAIGRGNGIGPDGVWSSAVVVDLVEVKNPDDEPGQLPDPGFAAFRFRPVVTRKTDISIFRAMLNPTKQDEWVTRTSAEHVQEITINLTFPDGIYRPVALT